MIGNIAGYSERTDATSGAIGSKVLNFGALLRRHRIRRGATQRQLADLSTVSVRAIRDLELGKAQRPRRDTVHLIADGLGLTGRERADFEKAAAGLGHDPVPVYDSGPISPPAPMGTLVGREAEVSMLGDRLGAGSMRLVTVTGLPGVGKSRIALEVASSLHREHRISVVWSSASRQPGLARDTAADSMSALVATALDKALGSPGCAELAVLQDLIGDQSTLLVMDGYEQPNLNPNVLAGLLQRCRGLRVLVTARKPFQLPGEHEFPLAPLAVPPRTADTAPAELAEIDSVKLLTRHIRQPDFQLTTTNATVVAKLCRLLDGIPDALSAAASWFMVCSPETLLEYVDDDPLAVVGQDLAASLRLVVGELDKDERALLGRLCTVDECWSMADAVRLSGLAPAGCAWLVRRLLVRGVVRNCDDRHPSRFAVLELVKHLHLDRHSAMSYLHEQAAV